MERCPLQAGKRHIGDALQKPWQYFFRSTGGIRHPLKERRISLDERIVTQQRKKKGQYQTHLATLHLKIPLDRKLLRIALRQPAGHVVGEVVADCRARNAGELLVVEPLHVSARSRKSPH